MAQQSKIDDQQTAGWKPSFAAGARVAFCQVSVMFEDTTPLCKLILNTPKINQKIQFFVE